MTSGLSNGWKIALQLLFVAIVIAIVIFVLMGLSKPAAGSHRVQFQIEATGGYAIITYQAGSVSVSKPLTVSTPWSKVLDVASGTEVYLTASNPTQTGKLNCSLSLDKAPWKLETTSAPKDGVACAGIVP
jgi:hypothetical protein